MELTAQQRNKRLAILEKNVCPEPNSGCWIWIGSVMKSGYGQYRADPHTNLYAHRMSYELLVGPIPKKYHLHHLCETRCCVNPSHLEPLLAGDHLRKTLNDHGRSYFWTNRVRLLPHCGKGHEFTEQNTYWQPGTNKRYCRACIKLGNQRAQEISAQSA